MSQSPWELPPDDRIAESFKSPYDPDGEYLSAVISAVANEMAAFEDALTAVNKAKFVDTAEGQQLDKLASLVQLERRTGESDSTFRLRIKVEFLVQFASGTSPDLLSIISTLLDADPRLIEILEPVDDGGPSVIIITPVDEFGEIKVPGDVFENSLQRVTAAGVDLDTWINVGEFAVRNLYDSAASTNLGIIGQFYGFNTFGTSAFTAGDDVDVVSQFDTATELRVEADDTGNDTKHEGFADSAFGVGQFDGEPDTTIVFGRTTADPFGVGIVTLPTTSETSLDGFSQSAFGAGHFTGGDDPIDTVDSTAATPFTASVGGTVTSGLLDIGFGSNLLDGQGAFAATDSVVPASVTTAGGVTLLFNATTDNTLLSEGVGTDVFDGGGAFSAGPDTNTRGTTETMTTIRLTSADSSSTTAVEGFSSDLFDGDGAFAAGPDEPVTGTTSSATTLTIMGANASHITIASDTDDSLDGSGSLDGTGTFG